MATSVTLLGVGDVGPLHPPLERYCELAQPLLASADLRFAQVERVYSDRGSLQLHSGGAHSRLPPAMGGLFAACKFDVVSLASNHAMDWGADALLDTRTLFESQGLHVVGAGENLAAARAPAIVERNGLKIAFLAYCSILHEGYEARADRPGIAPLRIHTYYEAFDYQPGIPPRVVTVPYEEDLAALLSDIAKARAKADAVILSLHWGIHFMPRLIADYQTAVARAAFAAGADLILGHHAHVPKAIHVIDERVCFYSLSNFMMSSTAKSPAAAADFARRYGVTMDPAYPHLSYGSDAKRSLIARATLSRGAAPQVAFLPVLIDPQLRPEPLRAGDPRFDDAVRYMQWASEDFAPRFRIEDDAVLVS